MAWIDCNTKINPQEYKQAENRGGNYNGFSGCITDGLSEEAIGYVNQAVNRTEENKYSIFDKETGLMPEKFGVFDSKSVSLKKGEDGILRTDDGQLQLERTKDGTYIVSYDSDGQNGFDRYAVYEHVEGMGYKKVQEDFDADGDGTNEVSVSKDYDMKENKDTYLEERENPDKKWWQFWKSDTIKVPVEKTYSYTLNTNVQIGVNADDMGYDDKNGAHYEFVEGANYTSKGTHPLEMEVVKHDVPAGMSPDNVFQVDLSWPSETSPEHKYNKREI